jgi:choline dehydrogenase-like flavoprotein
MLTLLVLLAAPFVCGAISVSSCAQCGSSRAQLRRLRGGATMTEEYDYVIVGGGSAGCVLANRLSADPANRILVLEAGGDNGGDLRVRVPAALPKLFRSECDWDYETEPGSIEHEVYLCRGKLLGGSSNTNVMLYHRGTAADHDEWEAAGAEGWGAEEVLPYYRMHEDFQGGESQYHGVGGGLAVQDVPYQNLLSKAFLKAAGQMGFRANSDFNDWSAPQEGFGRYKVMQRDGERCSAQSSFLALAKGRTNLCVRTGAHVTRLVATGGTAEPRVTGVEFTFTDGSEVHMVRLAPGGEALLCAGSIQSPQLLMLSGIGPCAHLEEKGIRVVKDLPGVGEGLQDHPAVLVAYESTKKVCLTDDIKLFGTGMTNPLTTARWLLARKGPLTSVACDHGGFFSHNSRP